MYHLQKTPTVDLFRPLSLNEQAIKSNKNKPSSLGQEIELSQLSINFYLNTMSFIMIYDEILGGQKCNLSLVRRLLIKY